MSPGLQRTPWLFGLTLMIAHMVILVAGAIGMFASPGPDPDWRLLKPSVRVAMWINDVGWIQLAVAAVLDVPVIVAFAIAAQNRSLANRLFAGALAVRLLLLALSVAAALYLASLGTVVIRQHGFGATWRRYAADEAINQAIGQVFLGVPLLIYALRWTPMLLPSYRRRLRRERAGQCLACGYDLRGSTGGMCPECGQTNQPLKT
jgi:hypothetical protein